MLAAFNYGRYIILIKVSMKLSVLAETLYQRVEVAGMHKVESGKRTGKHVFFTMTCARGLMVACNYCSSAIPHPPLKVPIRRGPIMS